MKSRGSGSVRTPNTKNSSRANIGLQRTAPCGLAAEAGSFGWRSRVVPFSFGLIALAITVTLIGAESATIVKTIIPAELSSKVASIEIVRDAAKLDAKSCAGPKAEVWVGKFLAVVTSKNGKRVSTNLNDAVGESSLTFLTKGEPQLDLNDYNSDGNPDFYLEMTSCMGVFGYHLLTINPSGRVTALHVNGDVFGAVLSSIGIVPTETGFRVANYDPAGPTGAQYRWSRRRDEFVLDGKSRKERK
jgi:hypothetical protein